MKLIEILEERSSKKCELCEEAQALSIYEVEGANFSDQDGCILICSNCSNQLQKKAAIDSEHLKCLSTSMWSEHAPVKVVVWRLLNRLREESWAADNLDMLYLDDEMLAWAKSTGDHENDSTVELHRDANGHVLQNGDAVVLTKSLDVKGSSLNARMGTVVRNIRLVPDNTEQIEGRIEGQLIVILTKYVRKQNG